MTSYPRVTPEMRRKLENVRRARESAALVGVRFGAGPGELPGFIEAFAVLRGRQPAPLPAGPARPLQG
jgi:hypothetical protein